MGRFVTDEALLTAIVDATIRVGRTDLLHPWVRKQQSNFQRVKRAPQFMDKLVSKLRSSIHRNCIEVIFFPCSFLFVCLLSP